MGVHFEHFTPNSMIDIGCGHYAWLKAAESLGGKQLSGFDGHWVEHENLLSENIEFTKVYFEEEMPYINERYDLCVCLELTEHLSKEKAIDLVELICKTSNTVLFSAAIKCQGGVNHINEQRQSFWIDLFGKFDYECIDIIRNKVWNNSSVYPWYRQNTFPIIVPYNTIVNIEKLRSLQKPISDVVHPDLFETKIQNFNYELENPTLRLVIRY